jgi:hypothetical protein
MRIYCVHFDKKESALSMAFKKTVESAGIDAGTLRELKGTAGRSLSALSFFSLRFSFNSGLSNAGVEQETRQKYRQRR